MKGNLQKALQGKRTTLLDILELSSLDVDDLTKGLLCVVGDTDGSNAVLDIDPLVLIGVLPGYLS